MSAHDYLCKALELAEQTTELYEKSIAACGDALGKEAFELLLSEGRDQVRLVREVQEKVGPGGEFDATCTLHETDRVDLDAAFKELAVKHVVPGTCATELTAVRSAKDMLSTAIRFYSGWRKQAEQPTEKEFIETMTGELRAQLMTLNDLEYYYEDPEGWALAQDSPVLDGA